MTKQIILLLSLFVLEIASQTCILTPEEVEGPYYSNTYLVRQNITEGQSGIPLRLEITVLDSNTCLPIPNAAIDIWHCNAVGIYSHFIAQSQGQQNGATDNSTFLRGYQFTDSNGVATADTIYPGWYEGRDVHIHIKVHLNGTSVDGIFSGGTLVHTGQMFFNDTLTDEISVFQPYASHNITRTLLPSDGIYTSQGGWYTVMEVQMVDSSQGFAGGLIATVSIIINPNATYTNGNSMGGPTGNGTNGGPPNGTNPPPNGSNPPPNGTNPIPTQSSDLASSSELDTSNSNGIESSTGTGAAVSPANRNEKEKLTTALIFALFLLLL